MKCLRSRLLVGWLATALFGVAGCSDSPAPLLVTEKPGDDVGYRPGGVDTVITGGSDFVVEGEQDVDCIKIGTDCVDLDGLKRERCGSVDAQADVVVVAGQVVDVICYPPQAAGQPLGEVTVGQDGRLELPQNQNGAVVTFAPATDGKATEGDLALEAERVVLIGNGIDKTIIGGNLTLSSNNAKVRGLTVEGNLVIETNANNVAIAYVRVEGNLVIRGNNALVVRTDVFGNVSVEGNNATLHSVRIEQDLQVSGSIDGCSEVFSFSDDNHDFVIAASELGGALACP